tara:strand:+ start:160 stop:384 length:225 start_codon:yes stop_codon:yes gene_type:complete
MPGHDTLAELTKNQTGTGFDGPFLVVGEGAPDDTVNFAGKGGLYINTTGNSTSTHWYVNLGTFASPTWTPLTIA